MPCQPEECRIIECGAHLRDYFIRNILIDMDELDVFRARYCNRGVYSTIYRYSSKEQSTSEIYGDLYFDFDKEDDLESTRKDAISAIAYLKSVLFIPQEAIHAYFSGSKGIHLTVEAEALGVEPQQHLNMVYRAIAQDVSSVATNGSLDTRIYDRRRLFRLPNSIHHRSGLYKVELTHDELKTLSIAEIMELATAPRQLGHSERLPASVKTRSALRKYLMITKKKHATRPVEPLKIDRCPPCIEELLKGVSKGIRNNAAMVLASYLLQTGEEYDTILGKLLEWNSRLSEPLPTNEIEMCVKHICSIGYRYGCDSITSMSTCNQGRCPIRKRRIY